MDYLPLIGVTVILLLVLDPDKSSTGQLIELRWNSRFGTQVVRNKGGPAASLFCAFRR